jgi:hypothetical protein
MIQAAVAILHAERGNPRGARSTWNKARAKLEPLPEKHMGIALRELCVAVDAFVVEAASRSLDAVTGRPLAPSPKIRRL